jgi:hypothetical protein
VRSNGLAVRHTPVTDANVTRLTAEEFRSRATLQTTQERQSDPKMIETRDATVCNSGTCLSFTTAHFYFHNLAAALISFPGCGGSAVCAGGG